MPTFLKSLAPLLFCAALLVGCDSGFQYDDEKPPIGDDPWKEDPRHLTPAEATSPDAQAVRLDATELDDRR